MIKKAVVTIAVGRIYYLQLAKNLIKSFLIWNGASAIKLLVLTDNTTYFEEFRNNPKVIVKLLALEESQKSFTSKFLLIDHIVAEENLFIDCDCLIYKPLDSIFDTMSAYDFTAIGEERTSGDFFCDIKEMINKFNVIAMPVFVGSVYYFKNNHISKSVFAKALELKERYDELDFIRLRGKENEEPLFALSMALYNQHPIPDNETIKADRMFYDTSKTNVLKGKTKLKRVNQADQSTIVCEPAIVHFNDSYSESANYLMEEARLKIAGRNSTLAEIDIMFRYYFKERATSIFKFVFRPIYHLLLGPSKVHSNKRVQ